MLMRAITPFINFDHEGYVEAGQEFEATPYRAAELKRVGLAVPAMSDTEKVLVTADPPPAKAAGNRRR